MATLRLFGADIAVDTAITTVQPAPGFSITTQLINSSTSIRIKLDGVLGAAKFGGFTTTPRCSLVGTTVQLANGSTVPNAGQVSVLVFGAPSSYPSPVTVIADPASGLGFTVRSNFSLKQYLADSGDLSDIAGIDSPDGWTTSQLVLSIPQKRPAST